MICFTIEYSRIFTIEYSRFKKSPVFKIMSSIFFLKKMNVFHMDAQIIET